jgi:hypothetical protein
VGAIVSIFTLIVIASIVYQVETKPNTPALVSGTENVSNTVFSNLFK